MTTTRTTPRPVTPLAILAASLDDVVARLDEAGAGPDGVVQFRDDIYGKDGLGSVPVASAARRAPDPEIVDEPADEE